MRDEEIKLCPFRIKKETYPSLKEHNGTHVKSTIEEENFGTCLKERCPAFFVVYGGYGQEYERCKRLMS